MLKERNEPSSTFYPLPLWKLQARTDALKEIARPCGRFRSPYSFFERMKLRRTLRHSEKDVFREHTLMPTFGVPLNWQALLGYLHHHNIIGSPNFDISTYRNDLPKSIALRLNPSGTDVATDGKRVFYGSFGSTLSLEETMSKAVGEMLERYFFRNYRDKDLGVASYPVLRKTGRAFPLEHVNSFLDSQKALFPFLGHVDETPLRWVKGKVHSSGKTAFIPAQFVFWGYKRDESMGERVLVNSTTSGCGAHFTRDEALLSSLLESIERDGFLIHWLNKISPNIIDMSDFPEPTVMAHISYLKRYGLEVYFLNTTTDVGVPSLTCVVTDRTESPVIGVGGAAGFNLSSMLMQSMGEALSIYSAGVDGEPYELPASYLAFSSPEVRRKERLAFWKGKVAFEHFSFFLKGKRQTSDSFMGKAASLVTPQERLTFITRQLQALGEGYELYTYEVKNPLLKKLGFYLVRGIVPRLIPLYLEEHLATLDAPRLREVPKKMGFEPAKALNPWPHPFP